MDNLTHTLTGLALSRAGLNRWHPRAAVLLMLSANAPDSDIVAASRGSLSYFEAHRGITHAIASAPVMALLCVLLVGAFSRSLRGWKAAWGLCLIGVASHLLLDWTNTYGIRLLLPFSARWLHLDLNNLVDLWIWGVLLLAWVGPWLARLVSSEMGAPAGSGRALAHVRFVVHRGVRFWTVAGASARDRNSELARVSGRPADPFRRVSGIVRESVRMVGLDRAARVCDAVLARMCGRISTQPLVWSFTNHSRVRRSRPRAKCSRWRHS